MIFRKLYPDAFEPVRSTEHSAGLDLFAYENVTIPPHACVLVSTGVTFDLDETDKWDWYIDLRVRSSLALRQILLLGNGAGVVDKDYAGNEIKVMLYNGSEFYKDIERGDKIAQMIVLEHHSNKANGVTFRYNERTGGFGSTGND